MNLVINVNVCRVCMQPGDGNSLKDDEELQRKFTEITRLTIDFECGLPLSICHKCETKLQIAHDFVRRAEKSERQLMAFLKKVNNDFANVRQENDLYLDEAELKDMLHDESPKRNREDDDKERIHIIQNLCLRESNEGATEGESGTENQQIEMADEVTATLILDYEPNELNAAMAVAAASSSAISSVAYSSDTDAQATTNYDENHIEGDIVECCDLPEVDAVHDVGKQVDADSMSVTEASGHTLMDMFELCSANGNTEVDNAMCGQREDAVRMRHAQGKRGRGRKRQSSAQPESFFCVKCQRDFSTRTNLTRHMATHGGLRPFACDTCGKSFTQNTTLKQHMYTHTGEKPHVCNVCKRGFTQHKSLVFHMRVHSGNKPFLCDICCVDFRQKHALKAHMMKHHLKVKDDEIGARIAHICIVCNELLLDNDALQLHMNTHLNNHVASVCTTAPGEQPDVVNVKTELEELPSEVTESSVHLIDVKWASTGEPSRAMKFQCRKCFKSFNLQKSLVRHLKMHEEHDQALSASTAFSDIPVEVLYGSNRHSSAE